MTDLKQSIHTALGFVLDFYSLFVQAVSLGGGERTFSINLVI